jgi:hypothetical protein
VYEQEPTFEVVALVERHLRDEHGVSDFAASRHLFSERNRPAQPLAHYLAEVDLRPAGFRCALCASTFYVEPSYGHPRRNRALRHQSARELAPLLRGLEPDEQERVIEDWDRGRYAVRNLDRIERRAALASKRPEDPEVARRRRACQQFLLDHYREHANKQQAIEALVALADEDPEGHFELVGRRHPFSPETYAGYWKQIPLAKRRTAREAGLRRAAERKAERQARLPGKLTR